MSGITNQQHKLSSNISEGGKKFFTDQKADNKSVGILCTALRTGQGQAAMTQLMRSPTFLCQRINEPHWGLSPQYSWTAPVPVLPASCTLNITFLSCFTEDLYRNDLLLVKAQLQQLFLIPVSNPTFISYNTKAIFLCFLCLLYPSVTGAGSSLSNWCCPVNWPGQLVLLTKFAGAADLIATPHELWVWLCSCLSDGRSRLVVSLAWSAVPAWFWSCSFLSNPQMTYEKNKAFPGWTDGLLRDTFSGRADCVNDFSKVPPSHCQQCHFQKVNPVARQQGKIILTTQHYLLPMWKSCKDCLDTQTVI